MIKRFNTLKLTPQVVLTTGLFAVIATLSIDWGLVLCLVILPALTFFNYAKGKSLVARIVYTGMSFAAGFIALFPAQEMDSNRRVSACNAGDDVACKTIVDSWDSEWHLDLVTDKNTLRLIELKKQKIANTKAEKAIQEAKKYKKDAKIHEREAKELQR